MYKSLFSRLSLGFFVTLLLMFLIIAGTLSVLVVEEPKHQFSERIFRHLVSEIGTPPTSEKLEAFSHNLQVSLTVTATNPNNFRWDSRQGLPEPAQLETLTTPETSFGFLQREIGDQIVLLRHENYNY